MRRKQWALALGEWVVALGLTTGLAQAKLADGAAAQVVSLQGRGELRNAEADPWRAAQTLQLLPGGAFVRTLEASKMALLFADDTQVRLNQNAMLQVKSIGTAQLPTSLLLSLGRVWAQTKRADGSRLQVQTPAATAGIRGTDWELDVDASGKTLLTVLSGTVEFSNSQGAVTVGHNEAALAEVGKAPVKIVLSNPRDRVQWVNALTVDPRRHLSPDAPAMLRTIAQWLQQGEMALARRQLGALVDAPQGAPDAAYLMLSDVQLVAGETDGAISTLESGLQRQPRHPDLLAQLARVYLLADRLDDSANVLARARDAETASVLVAQGDLARRQGQTQATLQTYERATRVAPGDDRGWYGLGSAQNEREAIGLARAHLQRALQLHPLGPGYRGELGTLETFANRLSEAEQAFTAALEQNPADYVSWTGLGLLRLKQGHPERALDAFLRAGVMEPRYARAKTYTAVAYYQLGRVDQALDELVRASQLDEKDPLPHFLASILYTDSMRPAQAIESIRAALRLLPNLKSLNQLANDQQGLTNLGYAFAFFGLEEWAQQYAQDSYYPFWAGSHLFLADRSPGLFTKNSQLFQGLIADPTVFGSSTRRQSLVSRPENNFSASARMSSINDSMTGQGPKVQASGYANSVFPVAYFADYERINLNFKEGPYDVGTATLALGAMPRDDVGAFLFVDRSDLVNEINKSDHALHDRLGSHRVDAGFHYKVSPDSQVWFKAGRFHSLDDITGLQFGLPIVSKVTVDLPEWNLRHTFSPVADHQLTWGLDVGHRQTASTYTRPFGVNSDDALGVLDYDYSERSRDLYVSYRWQPRSRWLLQADLFHQDHERTASYAQTVSAFGVLIPISKVNEDFSRSLWSPRLGLVYRFDGGPQVRMAYQRWQRPAVFSSMGPVATAGILLDDRMVLRGGHLERLRGQLEWELSGRRYFSAYFDQKEIDNRRFAQTPFALNDVESLGKLRPRRLGSLANDDMLEFVNTPEYGGGRIRSGGLAFNSLISDQWGLFGRFGVTDSYNTGSVFSGNKLPYLADRTFAVGSTWVSPNGWYFINRLVHRSERFKDEANLELLPQGWNGAFDLFWQSSNKKWLFRLSADDVFDTTKSPQYTFEMSVRF